MRHPPSGLRTKKEGRPLLHSRAVPEDLHLGCIPAFAETFPAAVRDPIAHPLRIEVRGERNAADFRHSALPGKAKRVQGCFEGLDPDFQSALSFGDIAGPQDFHPHAPSHAVHQGQQDPLHVKGARSVVLKESSGDGEKAGGFGEKSKGNDGEGEHDGRAGRSYVPMVAAARQILAGDVEDFVRARPVAFEPASGHGATGAQGRHVLRAQPRLVPPCSYVMQIQGLPH